MVGSLFLGWKKEVSIENYYFFLYYKKETLLILSESLGEPMSNLLLNF